jgi:hypothetical protein
MREELGRVESLLREVHDKTVNGTSVKEYYTTQEVARNARRAQATPSLRTAGLAT